jgi:para-nitrobenzyl esterase
MRKFILCLAALPLLALLARGAEDSVRVESGRLSGVAGLSPEVKVFKGIPYAAPPVGDLRWRFPKAPAKWEGVRKADRFSATCVQTPYAAGSPYRSQPEPISEDCLYLNVWTAARSMQEHRPVMVWIHGGALTRGSGSLAAYDGEEFAKKGVVLVTINYRLGVFGFFAHPELTKESDRNSSGNYGLLDQIAALEWVQKNISGFGGDPKRVTIFGESAGSWSVNALVATPLAKGLFQRAIGESGADFAPLAKLAEAEQAGLSFARSKGAESLAALRAKPAGDLIQGRTDIVHPVIDGWLLPTEVRTIFEKGKQNDVPLLIGSNADEGTAFTPPIVKAAAFEAQAKSRFGDQAGAFLKIYPSSSDEEAHASAAAALRDQTFGWEMRTWARLQTKTGKSRVYLYYFSRVPPGAVGKLLGAYHASEIRYVFHNMTTGGVEDIDRRLADVMSSYWVNFATTGNPNHKGLPKWPAYHDKVNLAMGFGERIAPTEVPNRPALDFLDAHLVPSSLR